MSFHIETANFQTHQLYHKQKKEAAKKLCLHLPKFHQEVTKVLGEQSITLTGCTNCGKVLSTQEVERAITYANSFPKRK
jgi:predicted phage tail protein